MIDIYLFSFVDGKDFITINHRFDSNGESYIHQTRKNYENIKERGRKWKVRNRDKCKKYNNEWQNKNREHVNEEAKKWRRDNRDKERHNEKARKWNRENPDKLRERGRKQYSKRKDLNFIPINEPFEGCEAHHLDRHLVIYVPSDLHRSIWHSVWTGKGMSEINKKIMEWFKCQLSG